MVRLDVFPDSDFGMWNVQNRSFDLTVEGTTTAIAGAGCCNTGVEQLVSISNAAAFPTAGLTV